MLEDNLFDPHNTYMCCVFASHSLVLKLTVDHEPYYCDFGQIDRLFWYYDNPRKLSPTYSYLAPRLPVLFVVAKHLS